MNYPTQHISVSIKRPPQDVYDYVSNPQNLVHWAAGLSRSTLSPAGDSWIADSPMGQVKVKFAPKNSFGIVDHDVTLPNGELNHNPFRVLPNGDGAELVFTLFRLPRMSDADYAKDAETVARDLAKLRDILEK